MHILIVLFGILLLVALITWGKLNAFLAFLIVSITTGLLLGIPLGTITGSIYKGVGDTLGSLAIIIVLGAMLGKLVAESGAAQRIATVLMNLFGEKYIQWALMVTGFIIGIPLFYNVGFVLMVPLIFSVVYKYKLPAVYIGLPMLASLSVTHGFLPPHPAPASLVGQFQADMGKTLLYGILIAIPAVIIAGPWYSRRLKGIVAKPLEGLVASNKPEEGLPGMGVSLLSSLLPVILLMLTTIAPGLHFLGDPSIILLISVGVATYTLGIRMGKSMKAVMRIYEEAVKDIAMILLIIGGAGALKEIFLDSGVSKEIANVLQQWPVHPLALGWLIAAIIRVCLGSATVAGLTAAGIILPLMKASHVNPNLMVLSVGAGSLMFSHVNDGGFWLFKEYFSLSIKDTLRSWSIMETIVSLVGLGGVMLLNWVL
ncbi:MAG: gluconate transporter [Sphingobacteriales bacterium 50-39]|nr:gluconate transporter [Sphingobacteriales bacterium]OJW54145.1 MAG: gluconate transporter [Sphingobacteriales bacterium 50-39]